MKSNQQLLGQKFSRLTVIEWAGKDKKRNVIWKCKCDCGNETTVRGTGLLLGTTRSCGCLVRELGVAKALAMAEKNKTHGMSRTPTWVSWSNMMQRCTNPKRLQFKDWGGRGIKPCPFIAEAPQSVITLIGERPSLVYQIDRINNDAGYNCGQCQTCQENKWPLNIKWSTRKEQCNNKRDNVMITRDGITLSRGAWATRLGKSYGWARHNLG